VRSDYEWVRPQRFDLLAPRFVVTARARKLAKTVVPGTKVTITGSIETSPMEKTPQAQKVIDVYRGIVQRRFEGDIVEWSAGGLTDGNYSSPHCATIDSLGVTGYDVHTVREYADLKTLEPRTTALVFLIHEPAAQGFGR